MAKTEHTRGIDAWARKEESSGAKIRPVHLWNPAYCGEIDMRIARDGTWFYQGTPICRPALVKLFASLLRKDPDRHVLVTPAEKVGILVEDAPFLAIEMAIEHVNGQQILHFRTNVEEWVTIDANHPLRFEPGDAGGLKPYVTVRNELRALVSRSLYYDIVAIGETRWIDGASLFGVSSAAEFFAMARADEVEGIL